MGIVGGRHRHTGDLLALDSWHVLQLPGWSLPRAPSPVNVVSLLPALCFHPDQQFARYIEEGLQFGFRVGFDLVHPLQLCAGNHPSAIQHPAVVWEHVRTEVTQGSLVGPLPPPAAEGVQVSPLGLVPMPQSNKWHLIVNLSAPAGATVNDDICPETCFLSYASVNDAVAIIQHLGWGAELVKMDLKDAYRVVPVHPQDHQLLGIRCDCGVYVDRSLPFGLQSAPLIFTAFADLVAWAVGSSGCSTILMISCSSVLSGLQKHLLLLCWLQGCLLVLISLWPLIRLKGHPLQ